MNNILNIIFKVILILIISVLTYQISLMTKIIDKKNLEPQVSVEDSGFEYVYTLEKTKLRDKYESCILSQGCKNKGNLIYQVLKGCFECRENKIKYDIYKKASPSEQLATISNGTKPPPTENCFRLCEDPIKQKSYANEIVNKLTSAYEQELKLKSTILNKNKILSYNLPLKDTYYLLSESYKLDNETEMFLEYKYRRLEELREDIDYKIGQGYSPFIQSIGGYNLDREK